MSDQSIWLTGLVLGAASQIPKMNLNSMVTITGNRGSYEVLDRIGGSNKFNLYRCLLSSTIDMASRVGVVKIAIDQNDGSLDKEALVLKRLQKAAQIIDTRRNQDIPAYNYDFFMPSLVETFVCTMQDNRRVNILGFCEEIKNTSHLAPISTDNFIEQKCRIDSKTSVWILGKLLKILGFAHSQGISNGLVVGQNVLIERKKHGVVLFDWTNASLLDELPPEVTQQEIVAATKTVIAVLGGDVRTGTLPDDQEKWYQNLLQKMIHSEFNDAFVAHRIFYETVFEHWPKIFYPFTTLPIIDERSC